MEDTGVMALLFAHLVLLGLVAKPYLGNTAAKEHRILVLRKSILFWLVSLLVVIIGWAIALFIMTSVYVRSQTPPDESVIWAVEFGVATLLVLGSAFVLRQRLMKL